MTGTALYDPINGRKWRLRAQMLRERIDREKNPDVRANLLELAQALERKAEASEEPPWHDAAREPGA